MLIGETGTSFNAYEACHRKAGAPLWQRHPDARRRHPYARRPAIVPASVLLRRWLCRLPNRRWNARALECLHLFYLRCPARCRAFRCRQARGHPSTPCDGKSQAAPPATLEGNAASKSMQSGGDVPRSEIEEGTSAASESGDPGAAEAPLATQGGELAATKFMQNSGGSFLTSLLA